MLLLGIAARAQLALDPEAPMALVKTSVACVREMPGHASELGTQAVTGTPVQIIDRDGDWYNVLLPDGYTGYIIRNALKPMTTAQMAEWRREPRCVVTETYATRLVGPDGEVVSDLRNGAILEVIGETSDTLCLRLPDTRTGYLARRSALPLDKLMFTPSSCDSVTAMARQLMGVSYLWGGTTPEGMDCSGLVKICYGDQGVCLPRNASQQAAVGKQLGTDWNNFRTGDLIFFESAETGRIVHVGISLGRDRYIHCAGQVRVNSLDAGSPAYVPSNILHSAVRIDDETARRLSIVNHPWYFETE